MEDHKFSQQLDHLLSEGKLAEAANLLDEQELLRDDLAMDMSALVAWPNATHMLCLIHADRLTDARFLFKRLNPAAAQAPEVQAAWGVLQCVWQQKYAEVWGKLKMVAWSGRCQIAVAALTEKLRNKVLVLIGKAYSVLKVPAAAAYLGITEAEAMVLAKTQGWEVETDGMLRITTPTEVPAVHTGNHLQQLTDYVLHLEA